MRNRAVVWFVAAILSCVALAVSCYDDPAGPRAGSDSASATQQRTSLEDPTDIGPLVRAIALALQNDVHRHALKADLARSKVRESKLYFNSYIRGAGSSLMNAAAAADGSPGLTRLQELADSREIEFYMPVPEHRAAWRGGRDLIVVWHLDEGYQPIAYDLDGTPVDVSEHVIPDVPVIVLVPRESDFQNAEPAANCQVSTNATLAAAIAACGNGLADVTRPPGTIQLSISAPGVSTAGVWLSRLHIDDRKESWTKGDPEIEIHLIGKDPQTPQDRIRSLQCLGAEAASSANQPGNAQIAYAFNMDQHDWWHVLGSGYKPVLMLNNTQLGDSEGLTDRFIPHVWEDDAETCKIVTDRNVTQLILNMLNAAVKVGIQVIGGSGGKFTASDGFQQVIQAFITNAAGIIETNDDFVGEVLLKGDIFSVDLTSRPLWPEFTHAILQEDLSLNGWALIENLGEGQVPFYPTCYTNPTTCGGLPQPSLTVVATPSGPNDLYWSGKTYTWKWTGVNGCNDAPTIACSYRWYRRDPGQSQFSLSGTSTQYSYVAPQDTFDFDLRAFLIRNVSVPIAKDADTLTNNYLVHVKTRPYPSVVISQPSQIALNTQYTWLVSITNGFGSKTYKWYRAEGSYNGYGPYQQVGSGAQYTGQTSNCDGFKLKVSVTFTDPAHPTATSTNEKVIQVVSGGDCEVPIDPN